MAIEIQKLKVSMCSIEHLLTIEIKRFWFSLEKQISKKNSY